MLSAARAALAAPSTKRPRRLGPWLKVYLLLIGLFVSVAGCGQVGTSLGRPLLIVGSVAVALIAFRMGGLALHAEVLIALFMFGPLLRRLIDLDVGYDPSGTMLIAPLAAMTVAFTILPDLLSTRRGGSSTIFVPFWILFACLIYGWVISAFQGTLLASSIIAAKDFVPPIYCMCLMLRPEESETVLKSAARCFLIVSPIVGIYGVLQHLDPQPWDQFWMVESEIPSIGKPLPGMVRVFSTMNSPVSFAGYATVGLLLFSFVPRSFIPIFLVPFVAIIPLCLAILLSGVRTAWISASVSVLFCLSFRRTRGRASLLIICLLAGVVVAISLTSFGDVISARLASMNSSVSDDGSGGERISDYMHVISDSRYIFGTGLAPPVTDAGLMALDGLVLMSVVQMGTTIGLIYVAMVTWAAGQALLQMRSNEGPLRLVAGAIIVGNLVIMPLTAIAVGELGFLFWMLVGVLSARSTVNRSWLQAEAP